MTRDAYRKRVLDAMPGTRKELQAKTGLAVMTIHHWTTQAHADGDCHISGWHRPSKGPFAPRFSAGPGKDAVCKLQVMTDHERCARYQKRLMDSGEWAVRQDRVNARRRANNAEKKTTTWFSALPGATPARERRNA